MAFAGALQDLAIPDVLQLLHASRRTGRLVAHGPGGSLAELRFRDGAIVAARHPSKDVTVGSILLDLGAVTMAQLDAALERQAASAAGERTPLVATLVAMGALEQAEGHRALRRLVEETVLELVAWREGSFEFGLDPTTDADDFEHVPGSLGEGFGLDTQGALLDALRILDERNHATGREARTASPAASPDPSSRPAPLAGGTTVQPPSGATPSPRPVEGPSEPARAGGSAPARSSLDASLLAAGGGSVRPTLPALARVTAGTDEDERLLAAIEAGPAAARPHDRTLLYGGDGLLTHALRAACAGRGLDLFASEHAPDHLDRLRALVDDDVSVAVVVDLAGCEGTGRLERGAARLMREARARFPDVPLVALTRADASSFVRAFDEGATSVLPRPRKGSMPEVYVHEMTALVEALVASLRGHFDRRAALGRRPLDCRRQVAALRQRMLEIRGNLGSSDISLTVLRYVAEIFDRCVIFLARRDDLLGLGAFGLDTGNETVSPAVLRLKVPIERGTLLEGVVAQGRLVHATSDDPGLRAHLYPRIGTPAAPDVVLVPLRAEDRTAAVIYADFGARERAPVETDALEILAHQAGLALELALYRSRGKDAERGA